MTARLRGRVPRPFWDRVDKSAGSGACWPWIGARAAAGYGALTVGMRAVYAHRAVLEGKIGRPLASGEMACHTCDNPPCCNPDHLYVGNALSNERDKISRGRRNDTVRRRGEEHHSARLTWAVVEECRRLKEAGSSGTALARRYGVTRSTMNKALAGRSWVR